MQEKLIEAIHIFISSWKSKKKYHSKKVTLKYFCVNKLHNFLPTGDGNL